MTVIDFEAIKQQVFAHLEANLPPTLYYHGISHTRDDVLPAAERLAELAGIDEQGRLLLRTAALYHDIGYTQSPHDHEALGARTVARELPAWGYAPEQIQAIADMIMATRMPQNPRTELEQLLCDADLDGLGREDFFVRSHHLRLELMTFGLKTSVREWYERQLTFLENHTYLSATARALRDEGKQANLRELRDLLHNGRG